MSNIQYANVWKCKIEPESARSRRIARHFFPIAASTVDTVPDRAGADKDSVREIWRERGRKRGRRRDLVLVADVRRRQLQ